MIDLKKYNTVFIVSSCVEPNPKVYSVFNRKERLSQLISTVHSCNKEKNSVVIISEGSSLQVEEKEKLKDAFLIENHTDDKIIPFLNNKQFGTISLWESALEKIEVDENSSIVFLSGRYTLNEHFTSSMEKDYAFKMETSWLNKDTNLFHTTCFKVKGKKKTDFLNVLNKCKSFVHETTLDIEHALWFMLKEENIEQLNYVEATGYLGSSLPNKLKLNIEYNP